MKATKKILSIILAILMIATSVPFAFAADTTLQVGDTFEADLTMQGSDNLTFRYIFKVLSLPEADGENGKLELVKPAEGVYPTVLQISMLTPKITYEGVTFDITSIGDQAFYDSYVPEAPGKELLEVYLRLGTVENIGTEAFASCYKLETANLSPYVDKFVIGEHAFANGEALTTLYIENGYSYGTIEIGQAAFSRCTALPQINIDYTVSELGIGAFISCKALTTVTFDGGKLTEIPGWCFADTAIESIAIPEGVTAITGEVAFYQCYSLRSVELPSTIETVADGAFMDCPLERVVFKGGETVEFVGGYPLPLLTVENGFGDGLYANGQQVTITANEKEGFAFTGWEIVKGDGTLADASAAETVYTMGSSTATLRPVYEDIRTECEKGNHEFVTYEESEATKCGKNAKETAKCENCEVTDTREISNTALEHSFSKYEEVEAPKCGVAGKEVAVCDNNCGTTDEKEIPALTHSFTKYEEVIAPECGKAGLEMATCDNGCGETDEREITALEHEIVTVEAQVKTCTTIGWNAYEYCTECDYTTYVEIPASHEIKTVDKKDATCTQAGHEAYEYCTECDYTTYKEIPVIAHTEETVKGYDATCTETGLTDGVICSVCKETLTAQEVIPVIAHTEETVKGYAATCTQTGLTDGVKCSVCKEILTAQEVIPVIAHTEETVKGYDATCTETGLTDGVKCSVCKETITAQHTIAKLAHKDDNSDYLCDYGCGHEFEKPAEPDTPDVPDTPDEPTDGTCDHLCHKTGFMGFIWKIVQFFWKLFRMNPVCDCGVAHW